MSLKVLITDDDEMAIFFQKIIILESKFTHEIISFTNGWETLDYLKNNYKSVDEYFIFLDINMPLMNGWELLNEINKYEFSAQVYVAMVSSYSAVKDKEAKTKYKQIVYLFEKPVTSEICLQLMELPVLAKYFKNPVSSEELD